MKIALGLLAAVSMLAAQTAPDTPDAHVAAATALAGDEYQSLFNFVCGSGGGGAGAPRGQGGGRGGGAGAGAAPRGQGGGGGGRGAQATPDRATWHAEPVKVFDNLYWFG